MSTLHSRFAQAVLVGATLVAVSACQDAVAPLTSPGSTFTARPVSYSQSVKSGKNPIAGQYIVVFRDGYDDVDARSQKLIAKTKGRVKNTYKNGLKGFAARITSDEAAALAADASVAYVEQDQTVTLAVGKPVSDPTPTTSSTTTTSKNGKQTTVSSPAVPPGTVTQIIGPEWGLDRVDQTKLPFSYTYGYVATGAGVNVYIIDSGIRISHTDFGGRATADFSTIADGYGAIGCNWHGTHVAAIVGGAKSGIAKSVKLHSVRMLDCNGSGSVSDGVAAIDWVVANKVMPAVINLSIAGATSQALNDAVTRAIAAGITVVVAAGNNATDACNYSPANAAAAITVGATDNQDRVSIVSNMGSCVDVMAPGESIISASSADDMSFQYGTGTSMASPFVAGIAAQYLQQYPTSSPAVVTQAILQHATPGLVLGLTTGTPNLLLRSF